jgi:DNA-binding NarL/FixJ family response regulator
MTWSVVLVDDHPLIRAGARAVVSKDERFAIVSECEDGESGVKAVVRHRPDFAIVDLGLPDITGVEVIERILSEVPACRPIVLSQHNERSFVESAINVGALGYVQKDDAPDELARCLDRVGSGGTYISTGVASTAMRSRASLSSREREVVTWISEGLSSREIAEKLGIAARTVDAHRNRIMSKLGIHKITGLVRYAIREGYIAP